LLHRRYPISSLIRTHPPPQKARPVPRGVPVGWSRSSRLLGLPVLLQSPCAHMPPPIPRWNRRVLVSLSSPPIAAFPVSKAGRLPHQHFQGLLSVHYSLQPVGSRGHLRDPFHRRLQPFRHLHDCSDCYRLERKLPGGSVSHWVIAPFHGALRGLLRLHSYYGPSDCSTAQDGLCHEASTRTVARPRRSSATRPIDISLGGFFLHW
jgi:hypothetical protein